jgi:hypothetical protein
MFAAMPLAPDPANGVEARPAQGLSRLVRIQKAHFSADLGAVLLRPAAHSPKWRDQNLRRPSADEDRTAPFGAGIGCPGRRHGRLAKSLSQGDKWNRLISRYMVVIPPSDELCRAAEQTMSDGPALRAHINAIVANVGAAARDSRSFSRAANRSRRVLSTCVVIARLFLQSREPGRPQSPSRQPRPTRPRR